MNISGPAAVAKPEMLFYAPGDLTVTQKRSAGMRSLHPLDAERMGFGHRPTSILQRKIAFVRTNALLAAEALKKKEYQMGV